MGWIFLPIMSLIFSSDLDTSASKWSFAAEEDKAVATVVMSTTDRDPPQFCLSRFFLWEAKISNFVSAAVSRLFFINDSAGWSSKLFTSEYIFWLGITMAISVVPDVGHL